MSETSSVALFIVSTPIGNLADMSPRAVETLREVDLVLAEDTRAFMRLANHFGIATKVESFFEHNETKKVNYVIELIKSGKRIALVSEAGTPLINDPGYPLIQACYENEIRISVIPGPSSVLAALAASGFELHRFTFEGFIPPKAGKRQLVFEEALNRAGATAFFESPHRIKKSLTLLNSIAPDAEIFIAREISKIHEEFIRGPVAKVLENLSARDKVRGEIVLVLRGARRK